ncbi:MAG: hypothetical protein K0S18_2217 [Anaerocolumna sp.]|jgi:hypothetical protein|nr:hypothetical protein [Anaerocolumna sp.]
MTGFDRLEENIETTIYEGILKLGKERNDSFSIYYDLDLLNYLLETNFKTKEECFQYLNEFMNNSKSSSYEIKISLDNKRFRFTVFKEGIQFIENKNKENYFLRDMIETVKTHHFNLEDILRIFKKYSNDFICENIDHEEFQYVLYFKDTNLDPYKYCFSFDQMGGYYHRLLDYYYKDLDVPSNEIFL